MIRENLSQYADHNWKNYLRKVSELSGGLRDKFKEFDFEMYSFDDIVSDMFKKNRKPASVDGVSFSANAINLVEFKTGFYDRIDINNPDPEKGKCKRIDDFCEDFWDKLVENRKNEKKILHDSIVIKAVESYVTLEKKAFPVCLIDDSPRYRVIYWVVIDSEPVNAQEDMLASLANKDASAENTNEILRKSLTRLIGNRDVRENDYYYDDVKVISWVEFCQCLKNNMKQISNLGIIK